jgi:nucleotide-binding universal stress UspA family protein
MEPTRAERLAADDEDAEVIVVGSHGRGRFKATFLGNVSNSLVGVVRCPVLIVPPGVTPVMRARHILNLALPTGEGRTRR